MDSLRDLFEDTVKDLYNAEKQFIKGMAKLEKAAQDEGLKKGIAAHRTQSEGHLTRLEKVAELCGIKPGGKVCKAAQGLTEETNEHLEEGETGPTLDAAIISCAQKNEHYEICSYGTLINWAETLGLKEVVGLFQETLAEEKQADALLTKVSQSTVNRKAAAVPTGAKTKEAVVKVKSASAKSNVSVR